MPCIHDYELLEPARARDGKKVWIFYCKRCLDLQEVVKSPEYSYESDKI
jgi:hypothetical protein